MPSQETKLYYDPPTDFEFITHDPESLSVNQKAEVQQEELEAAWDTMTTPMAQETH